MQVYINIKQHMMLSLTKPLNSFPHQYQPQLPSSPSKHRSLTLTRSTGNDGAELESVRPPETVEIRFKRGSRRRRRADEEGGRLPQKKAVVKSWDEMSISEKALELYVGEKGLLFWLNKFAYASIFIVIGGWILFRFVGPALNLYQLDAPPLPPSSLLKGS